MRSNLSKFIFGIGIAVAVLSSTRYFLIFYDLDRVLMYNGVALVIIFLSYIWDKIIKIENNLEALEEGFVEEMDRKKPIVTTQTK